MAGKTGTSQKYKSQNENLNTFISIFPSQNPKYVLLVTLDEPNILTGKKSRRTAGWTAAPIASEIIFRVAPFAASAYMALAEKLILGNMA